VFLTSSGFSSFPLSSSTEALVRFVVEQLALLCFLCRLGALNGAVTRKSFNAFAIVFEASRTVVFDDEKAVTNEFRNELLRDSPEFRPDLSRGQPASH